MSNRIRSQIDTSNINITGKSGRLRTVMVRDTASSNSFDATIAINIDAQGSKTFTLNEFSLGFNESTNNGGAGGAINEGIFLLGADARGGLANDSAAFQLNFLLEFSTSLVVSVSSANSFFIIWDEDIF